MTNSQPTPDPRHARPISATVVMRYDDGTEHKVDFHEGGELELRVEQDQSDDGCPSDYLTGDRRWPGPHRLVVTVDATYPFGAGRPDGTIATTTRRRWAGVSDA